MNWNKPCGYDEDQKSAALCWTCTGLKLPESEGGAGKG